MCSEFTWNISYCSSLLTWFPLWDSERRIMVCHPKFSCLEGLTVTKTDVCIPKNPKNAEGQAVKPHLSLVNHQIFTYISVLAKPSSLLNSHSKDLTRHCKTAAKNHHGQGTQSHPGNWELLAALVSTRPTISYIILPWGFRIIITVKLASFSHAPVEMPEGSPFSCNFTQLKNATILKQLKTDWGKYIKLGSSLGFTSTSILGLSMYFAIYPMLRGIPSHFAHRTWSNQASMAAQLRVMQRARDIQLGAGRKSVLRQGTLRRPRGQYKKHQKTMEIHHFQRIGLRF